MAVWQPVRKLETRVAGRRPVWMAIAARTHVRHKHVQRAQLGVSVFNRAGGGKPCRICRPYMHTQARTHAPSTAR